MPNDEKTHTAQWCAFFADGEPEKGNTASEVIEMAKQGMKRPEVTHTKPKNEQSPVPEIQGKAKHGKEKARPIIAGTENNDLKVWHT